MPIKSFDLNLTEIDRKGRIDGERGKERERGEEREGERGRERWRERRSRPGQLSKCRSKTLNPKLPLMSRPAAWQLHHHQLVSVCVYVCECM